MRILRSQKKSQEQTWMLLERSVSGDLAFGDSAKEKAWENY